MYDREKLMEITANLLESVAVSENVLNSLILSQNPACQKLGMHFSHPDLKAAEQEIANLVISTVTEAAKHKRCLQGMRNSADKLTSYIKYPSLNYYWV